MDITPATAKIVNTIHAHSPKAITVYPRIRPAVAIPLPVTMPALCLISFLAMWPVMTATIGPMIGKICKNPRIPAIKLIIAVVLVRVAGGGGG